MPFVSIDQTELPYFTMLCFAGAACDLRTNSSELAQTLELLSLSSDNPGHPDLLRRFVPTPYVFSKSDGPKRICVESNDLQTALGIWRSDILQHQVDWSGELVRKLIQDRNAPANDSETSIVPNGALRVLYLGRGTILIYDPERLEILGFISREVKIQKLVLALIPALLDP